MIIVYTGNGKGKTTAAIGAVIRSVGWKKKVVIVQFIKHESWPSGERTILRNLGVEVFVMGKSWVGIMGDKKELNEHKNAAKDAVEKVVATLNSAKFDLIVCDEILGALHSGLILKSDVLSILNTLYKMQNTDLIMTGQNAPKWLIEKSDLVTEMKKIKHPYDNGLLAKKGIDF